MTIFDTDRRKMIYVGKIQTRSGKRVKLRSIIIRIYREGAQTVVVSRGLGTHSVPVRLWNWPELIVLELSGTSEEM